MIHDAHGWWIAEAGPPPPLAPLRADADADVVVIGGGFTGLWAAWHVLETQPDARVVVLERDRCGFGPSGRNGGFVQSLTLSRPVLRERFGERAADALVAASEESVRAIGRWCEAEGVDAWYRAAPHLIVYGAPAQEGKFAAAVDGDGVAALDGAQVRARCDAAILRGGVEVKVGATVHPARLAFGLRERLLARGVAIHEGSPVRALDGAVATTDGGARVRARAAIVAVGPRSGALPPLRDRLTIASSHIVLTEPVPDVVAALGWTGGEAISDARTLLHYLRTTPDGRILFGWAGGRMAAGARPTGRMEVDPDVIALARADLVDFFPALADRRVERAWGGPIDVSPTHLPFVVSLPGGHAHAAFGYTGNGVGPSHLAGRVLAALALGRGDDEAATLPIAGPPPPRVPPEPLRVTGAAVIRRALVAKEAAEQEGRRPGLVARVVAGVPARMGIHIVR
jgi:glycine/D-amino acid oxidase-like deaminating enzyme